MDWHVDGQRRLSILLQGELFESNHEHGEHAGVGSVGLKAARFVHKSQFGSDQGTTIISALLPDPILGALGHGRRLHSWCWHHSGFASLAALRLAAALRLSDADSAAGSICQLLPAFSKGASRQTPSAPRWMQRVRQTLHRTTPPAVESIARTVGMHPVALSRRFRHFFGCSMTCYRQRVRVASVAQALLEGDESLTSIAFEHGFSDTSHLNRVFRRELGVPPGLFRKQLRQPKSESESFKMEWTLRI